MIKDMDLLQEYLRFSNPHIQFRGNLTTTGETVYGGFARHSKVSLCPVGITEEDIKNNLEHLIAVTAKGKVHLYAVAPDTLSLHTNLIDRNGVEVYTGDIVKYKDKEYWIEFSLGAFYLAGGSRRIPLYMLSSHDVQVLTDRPVKAGCVDLQSFEIKAQVLEMKRWVRGGFSYNIDNQRLDTLITDGLSDWNLPVQIRAMKIREATYCFGFGVVDEAGVQAYTGDILEFTGDVAVDDFVNIKAGQRGVMLMAHGGIHVICGGNMIAIQDLLSDNKIKQAKVVNNVFEVALQ